MIALAIIGMAGNAQAQGRGHQNDHAQNRVGDQQKWSYNNERKQDKIHRNDNGKRYNRSHPDYRRREVHTIVHHHDRYCNHAPVVARRYHTRPHYIYYRDYDVYYDFHRNVYISYSGRNWTVSTSLPRGLYRVDLGRAVRMEVDYDLDDFPVYLERSRPTYRRVYTEF